MDEEQAPLLIPAAIHDAMVAHCLREAPLECCGLLTGIAPRVSSWHPLRNEADSATNRYFANPHQIIEVDRECRRLATEFLAIYHSHPRWAAIPSRTDLEENYYGALPRIIVSLLGETPEVRVWRLEPDSFQELPWQIVPSPDAGSGSGDVAVEPPAPNG
jgi:proteasome lid subunit RPN8/RPN11